MVIMGTEQETNVTISVLIGREFTWAEAADRCGRAGQLELEKQFIAEADKISRQIEALRAGNLDWEQA
jgi:hypothetical protein